MKVFSNEVGITRDHTAYFQSVRDPLVRERNKLIIRLHKLLKDMPADPVLRKQHEQNIGSWMDASLVKQCSNCAKSFQISRRKRHCRLCGRIMCQDCSKFLPMDTAVDLASPTKEHSEPIDWNQRKIAVAPTPSNLKQSPIRSCDQCFSLLKKHESRRTSRLPIVQIYAEVQQLRRDVAPDLVIYTKIVASLRAGESNFTLGDASTLRTKIDRAAAAIDELSKRILALPADNGNGEVDPNSLETALRKSIRQSCVQLNWDWMLTLPRLPTEEEVRQIKKPKKERREKTCYIS